MQNGMARCSEIFIFGPINSTPVMYNTYYGKYISGANKKNTIFLGMCDRKAQEQKNEQLNGVSLSH
jgi:hypothetical protein